MKKIKVLIVDDSKTMCEWLTQVLSSDPQILVVGHALDPYMARDLIKSTNPDVLTLDIIMPRMDGLTFLKNIMRLHPMPVVMLSSLTDISSVIALEALALGAFDYCPKPTPHEIENKEPYVKNLIATIKEAASANLKHFSSKISIPANLEHLSYNSETLRDIIIVIGASTGGIETIEYILSLLPKTFPPIVITQHIRQEFSSSFANRINKLSLLNIKEARDKEEIMPGNVYIAPGWIHLCIKELNNRLFCSLEDTPPKNGHKPSVDVLFHSAAGISGKHIIGVLLTGMGTDGAEGAKAIHQTGGIIIAQDKETSVVWGMPGSAVKLNAVDYILPLNEIPAKLFRIFDELALKKN